jgi:hypothetical protein
LKKPFFVVRTGARTGAARKTHAEGLGADECDSAFAGSEVVCEEYGKRGSFPPDQRGSVQQCPHCKAYVDVSGNEASEGDLVADRP